MLSLRMLGRVAPKSPFRTTSIRSLASFSRSTSLRPSWQSFKKPSYPAFSTSVSRREPAGESDQVLSEKLSHERSLELENSDTSKLPEGIQEFQESSGWKIEDGSGTHDVVFTKEFGNEVIKIEFSINDMDNPEEEMDEMDQDTALSDEDFVPPKQTINQSGARGGPVEVMPEDSVSPADRGEVSEQETTGRDYPLHLDITITKPGDKAIEITAVAHSGAIEIDSLSHVSPGESDSKASHRYPGPAMRMLDPDLQSMFESYLEERGIDAQLINLMFTYVDWKEQREYVDWLSRMKDFVDA